MCPREVFLGTHVHVVVVDMVEHSVYACHRGYAYRARWQPGVTVCVVWRVDEEQLVVYAPEVEPPPCVLYRGVGLERHACLQPVDIHAGHHGFLCVVGCLLVDNARHGYDLDGGHACRLGLALALWSPEAVAFLLHTVKEILRRDIPVDIVCIGYEECLYRECVETIVPTHGLVIKERRKVAG